MTAAPAFHEACRVWLRIGLLSWGGPAAQMALMHREIVEERGWMTERQYLDALSFCMLLPGPEAMQLATYSGWRLHGVRGGLAAGLAFILPGALVVLALAMIYAAYGALPVIEAVFLGVKAAVLAIVVEALARIAGRALGTVADRLVAVLAFTGIFFLGLPFPLIVIAAAFYGLLRGSAEKAIGAPVAVRLGDTLRTVALWLAVWLVPLGAMALALGGGHLLTALGWFFSKLAVVSFGGAYAALTYMAQDVVTAEGWLTAGQMMDGLGLAETTPGPLILVTEFVGFTAGANSGGMALGVAGALVALWATFAPCFLWIFAAAPYVEWINAQPRLRSALRAIAAAVVGVIANLALWFALHVFFGDVTREGIGPLTLWLPDLDTLDPRAAVLAAISAALLFGAKWSVPAVLAVAAGAALAMHVLF